MQPPNRRPSHASLPCRDTTSLHAENQYYEMIVEVQYMCTVEYKYNCRSIVEYNRIYPIV